MRCLGSSKQQVCCQAIHAGVWELSVQRWARRILATAVACVAPAGAGVVHGYLESENSVALQQRCLQRGLKVGPYSQNDQNFHCAPRSVRLRPPQLTVLSTTLLVTNLLLLSRRRATRRAPAPPACTSDNTLLHKLHLSIMSYLPWLKWRGGCGWVLQSSVEAVAGTHGLQLQQPVACYKG